VFENRGLRNVFGAKTGSNRIQKIANAELHNLHACEDGQHNEGYLVNRVCSTHELGEKYKIITGKPKEKIYMEDVGSDG
jgi:hypothetical protein